MLKIAGIVVGLLVLVVLAVVAWLYYRAIEGGRRAYAALAEKVRPVVDALQRSEVPSEIHLVRFAEDRVTRKVLFDSLAMFDRTDLFPAKYRTWELMAEADLVAWLCHPNELGCPPFEIELVSRVPEPDGPPASTYFVFRYRTEEPHWATKDGWLAGVAGPYATGGTPEPQGRATFSRFEPIDSRTPAEHVAIVHASVFGTRETLPRAS